MLDNKEKRINFEIKSESGFALFISLIILLTMSILGATLVFKTNNAVKMSNTWQNSEQSFYAAEVGVQAARRWLENEISSGNKPTNTIKLINTFPNKSGYPLNNCLKHKKDLSTISSSGAQIAYYIPNNITSETMATGNCNNEQNFVRLSCEMDVAGDPNALVTDQNLFSQYGYSFFIIEAASGAQAAFGTGGEASLSSAYVGGGSKKNYYYKVISCGVGSDSEATIEAIVSLQD